VDTAVWEVVMAGAWLEACMSRKGDGKGKQSNPNRTTQLAHMAVQLQAAVCFGKWWCGTRRARSRAMAN
jgi:hypothetical protein